MKIAQIAPPWITIPSETGGDTENVLSYLVEALVAQEHDVTLFAPADAQTSAQLVSFFPQALRKEQVPWYMHFKAYYHLQKTAEYIREQNFDIVHGHLSSSSDRYIFPLLASLQIPCLVTAYSLFPFDNLPNWGGDADMYFMEWASKIPIVAISENARSHMDLPLTVVEIIHPGIPLEQFPLSTEPEEGPLVWIGRFVEEKGAHLAIEVARRSGIPLYLVEMKDEDYPRSLPFFEQEIAPHLNNPLVHYTTLASHEQKIALLSEARAFLNPIAWEEPFSMLALEAMATGCPVVTFNRGAMPEIVQHGKSGFLVHTLDEMVNAIPRLATLQRSLVREHVQQHFSASSMAKKYLSVYKKLIL